MDGEIDPDELAAIRESDADLRIVDIRDERAFRRGHVPGSESIPFPELSTRVAELAGADRIVTVCPHGIASRQAATLIGSYAGTVDARVESLRGGIEGWEAAPSAPSLESSAEAADGEGGTDAPDEGPDAPF